MYDSLLTAIAGTLGGQLSGLLTGDAATLYHASIATGHRTPDWGSKLLTVLGHVSKDITKVDAIALAKELEKGAGKLQLGEAVGRHLTSNGKLFFLLFDDTDQVASPDKPEHLNRIWGLLLAVKKLSENCPNLRSFVTLRLEIWLRLITSGAGQRDQRDHIRPLVANVRTDEYHMIAILDRRLELACGAAQIKTRNVFDPFFEGAEVRLPTSSETRPWTVFSRSSRSS